jgi:hypothetical protein
MCTVPDRLWGAKVGANVRSHRAIVGDIRQRQAVEVTCHLQGLFTQD